MIPMFIRLREDQHAFLKDLPGTISEHLRRAIDDYIEKKKNTDVSVSLSGKKGVNYEST